MKLLALTIFLLHLYDALAAKKPLEFTTCSRKWAKIGCYHDSLSPRPLPELLLNDRDIYSSANDGHVLDWHKWRESLHSLACRCAEKARQKGYKVFGLQFYGECWGGPSGEAVYSKDGPSNNCIQNLEVPRDCSKEDHLSECVGGPKTNYIYYLMDNTPEPQSPDVDGGWSKWSDWTSCSKSCGKGQTSRERVCNNPTPKGNGKPCEGASFETVQCHIMECPSPCHKTMDVGFVIDSSSSVRRENFAKVKNFLIKLIDELDVTPQKTHVGVIQYNHRSYLLWNLAKPEYQNKDKLKKAVENIKFIPGATRTDKALEMAADQLLAGPGHRNFVPHLLLVLTDGQTGSSSKPYSQVMPYLRSKVPGIRIVSIGVGPFVDKQELKVIAMGKDEEVFQLDSFSDLIEKLQDILKTFCKTRQG
ncbi:coadhesin [Exaiptasia diaphana]|uniref:VWFA domain-containing protein n=1 Tax=Exaiptasia diaphana TaxID=2652724 RepID=A0A913XZF9_EXADI|nr:coadhesin [Exaiptasia diaphana]KXJ23691.1 Matrilin-3 [Exaiptasia diaphana]